MTARKQKAFAVWDLLALVFWGVLAGVYYDGDIYLVPWSSLGLPWWVAAVLAAESLGAVTTRAALLPDLFDDEDAA